MTAEEMYNKYHSLILSKTNQWREEGSHKISFAIESRVEIKNGIVCFSGNPIRNDSEFQKYYKIIKNIL